MTEPERRWWIQFCASRVTVAIEDADFATVRIVRVTGQVANTEMVEVPNVPVEIAALTKWLAKRGKQTEETA